jgi:hypothetical protein
VLCMAEFRPRSVYLGSRKIKKVGAGRGDTHGSVDKGVENFGGKQVEEQVYEEGCFPRIDAERESMSWAKSGSSRRFCSTL